MQGFSGTTGFLSGQRRVGAVLAAVNLLVSAHSGAGLVAGLAGGIGARSDMALALAFCRADRSPAGIYARDDRSRAPPDGRRATLFFDRGMVWCLCGVGTSCRCRSKAERPWRI